MLRGGPHVSGAHQHLGQFLRAVLDEAATVGEVRDDVAADELSTYCLHALTAAKDLPSKAAVCRLVDVTMTGLRPPH